MEGTAANGRADGCQGGEEKHPWVKAMVSKGHSNISYGGIGMLPMSDGRYRNTPITGIGIKHRGHSFFLHMSGTSPFSVIGINNLFL